MSCIRTWSWEADSVQAASDVMVDFSGSPGQESESCTFLLTLAMAGPGAQQWGCPDRMEGRDWQLPIPEGGCSWGLL